MGSPKIRGSWTPFLKCQKETPGRHTRIDLHEASALDIWGVKHRPLFTGPFFPHEKDRRPPLASARLRSPPLPLPLRLEATVRDLEYRGTCKERAGDPWPEPPAPSERVPRSALKARSAKPRFSRAGGRKEKPAVGLIILGGSRRGRGRREKEGHERVTQLEWGSAKFGAIMSPWILITSSNDGLLLKSLGGFP